LAHPEPLWGVFEYYVHPFGGELPSFEKNSGFFEANKGRIHQFLKVVGFE
jgi:hypothetical protein